MNDLDVDEVGLVYSYTNEYYYEQLNLLLLTSVSFLFYFWFMLITSLFILTWVFFSARGQKF